MIRDLVRRFAKLPHARADLSPGSLPPGAVPLDPVSPWPKFRGNALQTGRTTVAVEVGEGVPWEVATGKGVFSSPVVGADGTVFVGSADQHFYAVSEAGEVLWRHATGGVIDSSALLDDQGRVIFGAGDGRVHCLHRDSGEPAWTFRAHTPEEVGERFGVRTHNVDWFEGNVAMLGDGTVLAPNDNYLVYALDRATGERRTQYVANEMVWSCPAVNPETGRVFFASCFAALVNVFCFDSRTGRKLWTSGGLGTVSASPLLTSADPSGAVLVGGFDGILRALSQRTGKQLWSLGTRDHLYGSPAQLSDGTLVQASTDGSVYGLDPDRGRVRWVFDTPEPIRSSPVVDGLDRVYFGSGRGWLYCLDGDGRFRWAYRCIEGDRNDLNGSPGLGPQGVTIAGESGGIFHVPYDYPLTAAGRADPRCVDHLEVERDGARLYTMSPFGSLQAEPPAELDANQPLALRHVVRTGGSTALSAIDPGSLTVRCSGDPAVHVRVSADRRFISLVPHETWTGPEGGELEIAVACDVRTRLRRVGRLFFGGRKTTRCDQVFRLQVRAHESDLPMPYRPGEVLEIKRYSCPNPTILPSYNQIGFDSLHFLAALVEGGAERAVFWVVPGRLDEAIGSTVLAPELDDVFVLEGHYRGGLLTLAHYEPFELSFVGSWDMPFGAYRIATRVDPATGRIERSGVLTATVRADDIRFYGPFLKLAGMSDLRTGAMHICGGVELAVWGGAPAVDLRGEVTLDIGRTDATATLRGCGLRADEHVLGILLVDARTGAPVPTNPARSTTVDRDAEGLVTRVRLDCAGHPLSGRIRGHVMVDTHAVLTVETEV